jgi:ABC-type uncharacterized transport system ATPase subunit
MDFFGGLRNMTSEEIEKRKKYLFETLEIKGFKDKKISEF